MQLLLVSAGQTIFHEDDLADFAYLVEDGWVEIHARKAGGIKLLSLIGPGEIFGEMGLIDGAPRSATAVAKQDCRLLRFDLEQFNALLGSNDPFHSELLGKLVARFRAAQRDFLAGTPELRSETSDLGPGYAMLARYKEVSDALDQGAIIPNFQPVIEMTTGRWLGFEAMARWRQADGSLRSPAEFVPLAERTGLIRQIDLTISRMAMEFCQSIPGDRRPMLHLNFSAWHFRDERLVAQLTDLLNTHQIDPDTIRIELTESLMLDDPDGALRVMTKLSSLGVKLALDDFGTGFSSLSVLHQMPIDVLKIDRSLILGVLQRDRSLIVLKHVLALASDLGMEIVMEGVEDAATARALVELGCEVAQGYHFAYPLAPEEAARVWLAGAL